MKYSKLIAIAVVAGIGFIVYREYRKSQDKKAVEAAKDKELKPEAPAVATPGIAPEDISLGGYRNNPVIAGTDSVSQIV